MRLNLALLVLFAGCSTHPSALVFAPAPCPRAQPGPPPLPALVYPEALRAHDAAEHAARIGTEAALALCARRQASVISGPTNGDPQ